MFGSAGVSLSIALTANSNSSSPGISSFDGSDHQTAKPPV
jgi:hypothetical protein